MKITRKHFRAATGRAPEDDDLERSNCLKAGELGHWCCGWDHELDLPVFQAIAVRIQRGTR